MPFALHPQLAQDTIDVCRLSFCLARLRADARWPWLILVPQREGATEFHHFRGTDQDALMVEIYRASDAMSRWPGVEKVNIGALGNMVAQFHVHVVGRRADDPAWPGPVWGAPGPARPYGKGEEAALIAHFRKWL